MKSSVGIRSKRSIDITGKKINMLTAVKYEYSKNGKEYWLFHCDCGNDKIMQKGNVTHGGTKSCGCQIKEAVAESNKRRAKHGCCKSYHKSRLYRIWNNAKQRCLNPNRKDYERYGGRGITFCDEWKEDFSKFRDWAIENGYKEDLTLERIDNDKGYSPYNCKWITRTEQQRNTRQNRFYTINGETKTLTEWCEIYGKVPNTVKYRLKIGMSIEEALKK